MSSPSAFPKAPLFNIPHLDKWVHAFIFGALAFLMARGSKKQMSPQSFSIQTTLLILFLCMSYGAIIELLQHFFTLNRQGDVFDLMADTLGAIIGFFMVYKRPKSNESLNQN